MFLADDGLAPAAVVKPSQSTSEILAVATALEKGLSKRRGAAGGAGAARESSASLASLETPLQRYHRLASEISALEAELAAVAAADVKRPAKATPVDPAAGVWRGITAGVSELSTRLERLQPVAASLAGAGTDMAASGAASSSATSRRSEPTPPTSAAGVDAYASDSGSALDSVIASLESMAHELESDAWAQGDSSGGSGVAGASDRGAAAAASAAGSAAASARAITAAVDVESRVAALETALLVSAPDTSAPGAHPAGTSSSASTGSAALSSRLAALESRVALLSEPGALETVAARAKAAAAAVAEAAAAVATNTRASGGAGSSTIGAAGATASEASSGFIVMRDARVAAAVAALERWDSVAAALPHIADRLATLRDVNREAAAAPRRITALESAVRTTAEELHADGLVLRELRAGLADLARTVKANLELLPASSI